MYGETIEFDILIGKTISAITEDDGTITFECLDGSSYMMLHRRNCCEHVYLEDVSGGDLQDLVGEEIISADEEVCKDRWKEDDYGGSHTWTFYRIKTNKTTLTLRWYGTSNGYYSEKVDLIVLSDREIE